MLTELSSKQVVDDFLNKVLTDGGMDNVSPEVREKMFNDLKNRLEDRFVVTVLSNLNDEQITKFREISESSGNVEEMNKFISSTIPNAEELFARAMLSFRNVYLGIN